MQSTPAKKPQQPRRRTLQNAVKKKDYRGELQSVLKLSPPGGHLSAVIALYTCDPVKLNKSYEQVRRCIEKGLKGKVKVLAFGSLATGLALKENDIDLYVKACEDPPMSQDQLYALVMDFLCDPNKNNKFTEVLKVRRTRTPIIRCKHKPTRLFMNINVSHPSGAYNSEFIGDLMRRDKKLRDLCLFLKIWAKNLLEWCRMSSYCLISMIIVSLQVHGLLPSVQRLQSFCLPDIVRGINYSYNLDMAPPIPAHMSTLELIGNFFNLFSTIDFEKKAVSPFLGCIVDKRSMVDGDIREYTAQILAMEAAGAEPPSPFRLITCMYVQDPFDLHSNVAQTVSPPSLNWIKKCLSLASRATKDRKLRTQPEKLYDYLLFGLADKLEADELVPKQEGQKEKTSCHASKKQKRVKAKEGQT